MSIALLAARSRKNRNYPRLLPVPSRFAWTPTVNVFRTDNGIYSTDYDPSAFLVEGASGVTTYYVDSATGSAANPGTAALPKNSLITISGGRTTKLLIKARGTFYNGYLGPVQMGADNLCVQAWGGASCILTTEPSPTAPFVWTSYGSGVWSAPPTFSGTNGIDPYYGTDPETLQKYPLVASLAACIATPGSCWRDTSSGIKHYVHTLDGTSPATGHTIYGTNGSAQAWSTTSFAYDQRIQFIGVDFRGGSSAFNAFGDSTYNKRLDMINCLFRHAYTTGATSCTGSCKPVFYGCIAGPSTFDGFAYHSTPNVNIPSGIEINCIGRNNGFVSAANQGSTTHDTGKVLRVNGQYYNNSDDQIADVSANTQSWNLGCTLGPGRTAGRAGVHCGNDASNTIMYLDGCKFTTPAGQYDIMCQMPAATIAYRNMPAPHADPSGTGYIVTY